MQKKRKCIEKKDSLSPFDYFDGLFIDEVELVN